MLRRRAIYAVLSLSALVLVGCLTGCQSKAPEVATPKTGSISGRVLDSQGSPVELAAVTVAGRTVCSDTEGKFAVDGLKFGSYSVVTTAAAYGTTTQNVEFTSNAHIVVNTTLSLTSSARVLVSVIEIAIHGLEAGGLHVASITSDALSAYVFDTGMVQTTLGSEVGTVVDALGQDLGLCSGARDTAFKESIIDAGLRSVQSGSTVLQGLLRFLREHNCSPTPCVQREVTVSASSTTPAASPSGTGSGALASDPLAEAIAGLAEGIVKQDWWTEIWRPLGTASAVAPDDLFEAIRAQTAVWRRLQDAELPFLSTRGSAGPFVDIVYGSILVSRHVSGCAAWPESGMLWHATTSNDRDVES